MLCKYGCGKEALFKLKNGSWICSEIWTKCVVNRNKNTLGLKKSWKDPNIIKNHADNFNSWNRGKTKESDNRLLLSAMNLSKSIKGRKMKPLSKEHKEKVSNAMKLAHKEGRAHNIGMSRWNNEPSYPEKFFMGIIEREFNDKNYIREYPISRYSIDFAWVDKKLAVEIDGEQHEKFNEQKERDLKKNELLEINGWEILRIKWKDMFNDTQYWIKIAYDFIHI